MTNPRTPLKTDFPSSVVLSITPPPSSQTTSNVLLLFHGLGDTKAPFTRLATQLQLPYTCIMSVQAPTPVPALFTGSDAPSFTWGDDVVFDQDTGELDMDAGFKATSTMVYEAIINKCLIGKCGMRPRDIHLMGFGQGGMAALKIATLLPLKEEFGGVISIGGVMPKVVVANEKKFSTPVLLLGGSKSKIVTKGSVTGVKAAFASAEYVKWTKADDSMPSNRDEMLPLMRFWARRLGSRAGVPAGSTEIGR